MHNACICVHMRTYACICVHMRAHACTCVHMRAYACICMHVHAHAYACVCMHMHAHACLCMHMHAHACISMPMHAYACIYMHIHAYLGFVKSDQHSYVFGRFSLKILSGRRKSNAKMNIFSLDPQFCFVNKFVQLLFRLLSRHAALCYPWRLSNTSSYVSSLV